MKVLVADDDPVTVAYLVAGLRKKGFAVETAADTLQVVMKAMRTDPDAIVLDIHMPGGTGITALRRIKKSSKTVGVPVVAITGSATAEIQREALELGASECLPKPVDIDLLSGVLTGLIQG